MKSYLRAVFISLLFASASGSTLSALGGEGSWKIQVVGIMVTAPEGATNNNRSYCWKSGVTVSAMLSSSGAKIIDIEDSKSKIDSFSDDKGTDLMAAPDSKDVFNKPGLSIQLPSDAGVTSAVMDLKALGHPAKEATMLKIAGKVVAKVASDSQQATIDNAEIKPGTTFKAGEISLKISDASMKKGFSQKEEFMVAFSGGSNLKNISKIEFFDAQGTKLEASKRSWGGGLGSYSIEYALKKTVDHAKIVVSYWTDLKTVEVPFNIKTSVGL